MGFFKEMIRKYDPIVNLSRVIGVPIMKSKKDKKLNKPKTEQQKTREKTAEDKAKQDLTIGGS